jgi:outer membrane protein assembly factor BamA
MLIAVALLTALFATQASPPEVVAQIQVRGNVATPDSEIRQLAGLEIGMPVAADIVGTVTARLRAAKRFERVDVLKRYASISDPTQVVIVIVVDEGPVAIQKTDDPDHPTKVVRRKMPNLLVLPILDYESGYGFTYGARLTHPEPAGRDSRLSFPVSWGARKQIGADFEKRYTEGWLTRVEAGGSVSRRVNPLFDADDDREGVYFRGEHQFTTAFRIRALSDWQHVSFRGDSDTYTRIGGEIIFDNRLDPFLARNAVFVRATESRLVFQNRPSLSSSDIEAHGYLGLIGQTILVASSRLDLASGSRPDYLKPLLGGPPTVRGFETGTAAGDSLVSGSLELRVPLNSPLRFARIGVSAFTDAGTVFSEGQRFADAHWLQGVGGAVWFTAAFVRVNFAVAHGIGASTLVHVQGNVTF